MDKETFELYYGEKEADRAYVASLPGDNFTMPNVCACCLDKSAPVTVQKTVRRVNRFTKRPYYIGAAKFPLCPACMLHKNELSFKTGLSSAVSTVLAFAVTLIFNASPHSFTFGAVTLAAAYFLLLYLIKVPALSHEHTARSSPVALHYSVKPVDYTIDGWIAPNRFFSVLTFSNKEYARLFSETNKHASPVFPVYKKRRTDNCPLIYAAEKPFSSFLSTLLFFAFAVVCAMLITACFR